MFVVVHFALRVHFFFFCFCATEHQYPPCHTFFNIWVLIPSLHFLSSTFPIPASISKLRHHFPNTTLLTNLSFNFFIPCLTFAFPKFSNSLLTFTIFEFFQSPPQFPNSVLHLKNAAFFLCKPYLFFFLPYFSFLCQIQSIPYFST